MKKDRAESIVEYIGEYPGVSSSEIITGLGLEVSPATLRRELSRLATENKLIVEGQNKGTRYFISPTYDMFAPVGFDTYFDKEIN